MQRQWTEIADHENVMQLWLLSFGCVLVVFTLRYLWHRSKGRFFDDPPPGAVVYSENLASGRSLKSWFTGMAGARNSLKVVLTRERLFVRPIFPFLVIGPDFDLIHSIPLERIVSVLPTRRGFRQGSRIRFRLENEEERAIDIFAKRPEEFERTLAALGQVSESASRRTDRLPS